MKIRILDAASQDLIDGARFYEKQEEGLGSYLLKAPAFTQLLYTCPPTDTADLRKELTNSRLENEIIRTT